MAFINHDDKSNMSFSEKYKFWKESSKAAEKVLMIIEGAFMFSFLYFTLTSVQLPPKMQILNTPLFIVGVIAGAIGIYIFIEVQRVAFSQAVSAMSTKKWNDDVFFIGLSIAITVLIWYGDKHGGTKFLNFANEYTPNIGSVETDARVKSNDEQRKTIGQERKEKEKSLTCTECNAIRANYESKITNERSNLRKNESSAAWKVTENAKIRNTVKRLEAKRDAEIANADLRFQDFKNKALDKYDSRLESIDTMQIRVKTSIDSANSEEKKKLEIQLQENKAYGGYITTITQILLAFFRLIQVFISRKDGKSFVEIGTFMQGATFLSLPLNYIQLWLSEKTENAKTNLSAKVMSRIASVEAHKEKIANGDEARRELINEGVTSMQDAKVILLKYRHKETAQEVEDAIIEDKILEEKILQNNDEKVDNEDEKAIILTMIKGYEAALIFAEPDEIADLEIMLKGYQSALTILNL